MICKGGGEFEHADAMEARADDGRDAGETAFGQFGRIYMCTTCVLPGHVVLPRPLTYIGVWDRERVPVRYPRPRRATPTSSLGQD